MQRDSRRVFLYKTPYCYTLQVNTDITGTYVHENNHRDTVSLNRRNSIVSVVSDKGVISRESTVTNGKMISEQ